MLGGAGDVLEDWDQRDCCCRGSSHVVVVLFLLNLAQASLALIFVSRSGSGADAGWLTKPTSSGDKHAQDFIIIIIVIIFNYFFSFFLFVFFLLSTFLPFCLSTEPGRSNSPADGQARPASPAFAPVRMRPKLAALPRLVLLGSLYDVLALSFSFSSAILLLLSFRPLLRLSSLGQSLVCYFLSRLNLP